MKKFGNLRALMTARGVTQRQLVSQTGGSQSELSRKLTGARKFSLADAEKIAKVLNIPPELYGTYFFDEED